MWECLVALSTWAEGNSGQIQIVIAGGAIYLAWLGYKKVLEQIEISHKQMQAAAQQEDLHLKFNIIDMTNKNIDLIGKILIQYPLLKKELEIIHQSLVHANDPDAAIIKRNLDSLARQRNELEKNRKILATLAKSCLENGEQINENYIEHLNVLNKISVDSSNTVIEYQSMSHDIEGIKIEKNLN